MKRLGMVLLGVLLICLLPIRVQAAEGDPIESDKEYRVFLSFGGDRAKSKDWQYQYTGGEASPGMEVTDGLLRVGETTSVSIHFDEPVLTTWQVEPVLLGTNIISAEFSVQVYIDGKEVQIPEGAGAENWYEATGRYTDAQALRIGGGYNEWARKYIAKAPSGYQEILFVITANSIVIPEPAVIVTPTPEITPEQAAVVTVPATQPKKEVVKIEVQEDPQVMDEQLDIYLFRAVLAALIVLVAGLAGFLYIGFSKRIKERRATRR